MAEDKKLSKTQENKESDKNKSAEKTTTTKIGEKAKTQKKAVKNESAKSTVKEESKATKVTTKPVTPKYINSKEAKNPKKGQFSIILLIILLIVMSIFFINTFRKYAILVDLAEKASNYITSENYYERATYDKNYDDYGTFSKIETYRKGSTTKSILYSPSKGTITNISSTTAGSKIFMDLKTGKVMTYSKKTSWPAIQPLDIIGNAKFLNSIFTSIRSEKLDGVECYVLENKFQNTGRSKEGEKLYEIYIEKATGLLKQLIQEENVKGEIQVLTINYTYQFDNVKEENLEAPKNIEEYLIQE